jgi:hypothetical protein
MFAITTKAKIAAGIAAGALTLGAAGAYAAANAGNTITVQNPTPITLGTGTNKLNLISLNGTTTLTAPTFTNPGQCVSWLAQNKNLALAPQGSTSGPLKLSKNYHGKLMSQANAWCKTQLSSTTKTDATETETPDTTQSAEPSTDSSPSTDGQSGASHGHAYGHSKHAADSN